MENIVELAHVSKSHGIKGELKLVPAGGGVEDMELLSELDFLRAEQNGETRKLVIENVKFQPKQLILKFEGIDSIEEAQKLIGKTLFLHRDELPELEEDEFYYNDLIGFKAVDSGDRLLGVLDSFFETKANMVFVIKTENGFVNLPFIDDVFDELDIESGKLVVKVVEGYFDER